jgi:hypothetical protein
MEVTVVTVNVAVGLLLPSDAVTVCDPELADGTLKVTPAGIDPEESVVVVATCVLSKLIVIL